MRARSWRDNALVLVLVFGNVAGLVAMGLDPAAAVGLTAATGTVAVGMIRTLAALAPVPPVMPPTPLAPPPATNWPRSASAPIARWAGWVRPSRRRGE